MNDFLIAFQDFFETKIPRQPIGGFGQKEFSDGGAWIGNSDSLTFANWSPLQKTDQLRLLKVYRNTSLKVCNCVWVGLLNCCCCWDLLIDVVPPTQIAITNHMVIYSVSRCTAQQGKLTLGGDSERATQRKRGHGKTFLPPFRVMQEIQIGKSISHESELN